MKSIGLGRIPVRAIDVGCGDGIIAHEILTQRKATIVEALDHQKLAAEVAQYNLKGRAKVHHISAQRFFSNRNNKDAFDRFVINPPFFVSGSGIENKNKADQISRHDRTMPLRVWVRGASKLLRTGGELYCVFPTERLAELLKELSVSQIEPKDIWWLKEDKRKRRFFLRAMKNAKPGIAIHFDF